MPHTKNVAWRRIIEPEEVFKKTGYSRPHTVQCGPEGIYVSTLGGGSKDGTDGPLGVFIMDCDTIRARIEHVFGAQQNAPGGRIVRTIGIVRARAKIGLQNWPTTFAAW